jgi:metallo-beta-lactamase family protein
MQITCLGAAGFVTGSCYLLENDKKYLIDCGLFQGGRQMEAMNRQGWGFHPRDISALFLTHAHIDHCGRIPKLVKEGFRGKIYATLPTAELCKILLLDSAHIQEMEAEWQTRKNRRAGDVDVEPLYTVADAEACFPHFEIVTKEERFPLQPGLQVRFRNAGHILGSSILEIWSGSAPNAHKVVFSGDLGRKDQLIVKDPQTIFSADTLFIESTYGNRNHRSFEESIKELLEAIHYSYQHKEKVLIPVFAVERTQEILYILGEFFRHGQIPSMPVYLDSPLAIAATEIFRRMQSFFDEDAKAILQKGHDLFGFPQLIFSHTTQESIAINQKPGAAIILAGNGMCTAGRIKHHLKHNLWRRGASLVIVGFQAEGTLGRKIVDGAENVRIFGEPIAVRAKVFTIGGFSAHADQADLLEWISHFENPHMRIYVIHGERNISEDFSKVIQERLGFTASVPGVGDIVGLAPAEAKFTGDRVAEAEWQQQLARITQKLEKLQALHGEISKTGSAELLQNLLARLTQAESNLEVILNEANKAVASSKQTG